MIEGHFFISYSRRDSDFVERLCADLQGAGVKLWLDTDDLVPGTPNWERAIRHAIDNAIALILIASPDSLASPYVQGELTLARIRNLPIYPVWAVGDQWIECVPLDMVNYQYIDCRGDAYPAGVAHLHRTWDSLTRSDDTTISLSLHTHETVEINLSAFDGIEDLLNHMYINYLHYAYTALTYGTEWVIGNIHTKQLALPWDWLFHDMRDPETRLRVYDALGGLPLSALGVDMRGAWAIWEARRFRMAGIALHDLSLKQRLFTRYGERELWLLRDEGVLKQVPPRQVDVSQYADHFVMAIVDTSAPQLAFVQEK